MKNQKEASVVKVMAKLLNRKVEDITEETAVDNVTFKIL